MKKYLSLLLALCMSLPLAACGGKDNSAADSVEIVVFAAASMEESLNAAIAAALLMWERSRVQ